MKKTANHTKTTQAQPTTQQQAYCVSPETAALLDCAQAAGNLFEQIADAMYKIYGDDKADNAVIAEREAEPYLELCNKIIEKLHANIIQQITFNLGDMSNRAAHSIKI